MPVCVLWTNQKTYRIPVVNQLINQFSDVACGGERSTSRRHWSLCSQSAARLVVTDSATGDLKAGNSGRPTGACTNAQGCQVLIHSCRQCGWWFSTPSLLSFPPLFSLPLPSFPLPLSRRGVGWYEPPAKHFPRYYTWLAWELDAVFSDAHI